jgi:hypothetical protein
MNVYHNGMENRCAGIKGMQCIHMFLQTKAGKLHGG